MNDDAAEKASRRKSGKFADSGLGVGAATSGLATSGTAVARKVSALQAQAQHHAAAGGKRGPRLSTVVQPLPIASMEVMTNNFEEWMKLATDNVSLPSLFAHRSGGLKIN